MDRGRFSFMGGPGGPLWRVITYRLPNPGVTSPHPRLPTPANPATGSFHTGMLPLQSATLPVSSTEAAGAGELCVASVDGTSVRARVPFFTYLRHLLRTHVLQPPLEAAAQLPFNFWGGLVGYLGYELKAECGGRAVHAAPTPDAAFLFADRVLAVDHWTGDVFALAVYERGGEGGPLGGGNEEAARGLATAWVQEALDGVRRVAEQQDPPVASNGVHHNPVSSHSTEARNTSGPAAVDEGGTGAVRPMQPFRLLHPRKQYMSNIQSCIRALHAGESYEVCLTTAMIRQGSPQGPLLYKTLRALNPAPYGAWLNFGAAGPTLCCSSPERFLRGDRGGVLEARPIKGTAARDLRDAAADAEAAAALARSEKDRAENLMIVDLLRNDLGAVCEVGSVHVPGLMEIESYATVHQMVSTVRGLRQQSASIADCIQAAFPAGSMTGAPKVRTMQIIDELEGAARGVYSGSIGFISLNDCFDLNVVIRTLVVSGPRAPASASASTAAGAWRADAQLSIGAGGAIVVQSDVEDEFEEMRLKARALLAALGKCEGGPGPVPLDDETPATVAVTVV